MHMHTHTHTHTLTHTITHLHKTITHTRTIIAALKDEFKSTLAVVDGNGAVDTVYHEIDAHVSGSLS
jgi:hypothetical protein